MSGTNTAKDLNDLESAKARHNRSLVAFQKVEAEVQRVTEEAARTAKIAARAAKIEERVRARAGLIEAIMEHAKEDMDEMTVKMQAPTS